VEVVKERAATLQFLGATETVTGSKFLLSNHHMNWFIDCGLFQGLKELRLRNWSPLPIDASAVSYVVLTHAHIDHSGYLPLFVKNGFEGDVIASEPTVELCKILLPDSGYLQEEDARYAAKKGFSKHAPVLPLYTYNDAVATFPYFKAVADEREVKIDGASISLYRAGHILGSRFIKVTFIDSGKTILFAGDIGRYDALITREPVEFKDGIDYLVLESTYGDRVHPKEDIFERFARIINTTIDKGGKILIPAFAVGRTQDIIYILKRLLIRKVIPEDIAIYLNTPLGIDATDIYTRFASEHKIFKRDEGASVFSMPNLRLVKTEEESKALNALDHPAIILSASGMLAGGRILHHLKAYAHDPNSCLILVGFQAAGTRGRAILDGANSIKIHGEMVDIRCRVEYIESLSAHGDREDILRWLHAFDRPPRQIFLVHGEENAITSLKEAIERDFKGVKVSVPKFLEKREIV